jgi:toxin CcdB
MAQYDVYVNPNAVSREAVPYVVDVQSRLLDQINTRLTMPLRPLSAANAGLPRRLVPRLRVAEQTYALYAHQAAVVESRLLKKPVASLASNSADILGALDAVVSGV